jgi:X-X-X-Leu-X-X-Gly heptad repeat protein
MLLGRRDKRWLTSAAGGDWRSGAESQRPAYHRACRTTARRTRSDPAVNQLLDQIHQLVDGTDQLVDGTDQLVDGTDQLVDAHRRV